MKDNEINKLLYPDGIKEIHLCATLDDADKIHAMIESAVKQEEKDGWALTTLFDPQQFDTMIRVKMIFTLR